MLKSIVFNYPKNSLTLFEQAAFSQYTTDVDHPISVDCLKKITDFILSSTLLKGDYDLEIKITPKDSQVNKDECIFRIWESFYKRNPELMSILRYLAEKTDFSGGRSA